MVFPSKIGYKSDVAAQTRQYYCSNYPARLFVEIAGCASPAVFFLSSAFTSSFFSAETWLKSPVFRCLFWGDVSCN